MRATRTNTAVGLISGALVPTTILAAQSESVWTCLEGDFDSSFCWEPEVPGPEDTAIFQSPGPIDVFFTTPIVNDRIIVRAGQLTLDLFELSYDLQNQLFTTPSIVIGESLSNIAAITVIDGSMSGAFIDIGLNPPAFGQLAVIGAGSAVNASHALHVGNQGLGFLTISEGAIVSAPIGAIGLGSASSAVSTVTGAGSRLICEDALTIGGAGFADLTIDDGGFVGSGDAIVSQQVGSFTTINVRDPESHWQVDGPLDVGFLGIAVLTIQNGAAVSNTNFATIGTNATGTFGAQDVGDGTVEIDGEGSAWNVHGDLYVGLLGEAQLTLSRAGRVFVDDDLFKLFFVGGITVQVGSADDYQTAAIDVGGVSDGFVADLELVDGFALVPGDRFRIVEAAGGVDEVTLNLPELPDLEWLVVNDGTIVEARVGPVLGDVDGDFLVDTTDLVLVILSWGPCKGCPADLDGDGTVGATDLVIVINGWS